MIHLSALQWFVLGAGGYLSVGGAFAYSDRALITSMFSGGSARPRPLFYAIMFALLAFAWPLFLALMVVGRVLRLFHVGVDASTFLDDSGEPTMCDHECEWAERYSAAMPLLKKMVDVYDEPVTLAQQHAIRWLEARTKRVLAKRDEKPPAPGDKKEEAA